MRKLSLIVTALILSFAASAAVFAQTPSAAPKTSVVTGDVVTVDQAGAVLKTAQGDFKVTFTDKTEYKRVPAGNSSLKTAVPATLADMGAGDRLVVTGVLSADKASLPAKAVYLMTKSDIDQRQASEKQRWATRGISGRVTSVNMDTKQVTIEVRSLGSATNVVLTPKDDSKFLRYAPNSVSYNEAVASKLSDISAGDMIRAVGDRSADGASFAAEEIVTGAFQTVAGTVKSVDAEKNEVVITDLQSKKDITVSLASATTLKRFPEQMAQMMAARQAGGAPGGQPGAQPAGQPAQGGDRTARPANGEGRTGQGGPGGMGRGGIDEMLERFPTITAADLKVGDMIAVSSSRTGDPSRLTAIKLLAGVEPFIRASQASAAARGRQGGNGSPSLEIPGLDGFDMP